jgi:hypothetical protein
MLTEKLVQAPSIIFKTTGRGKIVIEETKSELWQPCQEWNEKRRRAAKSRQYSHDIVRALLPNRRETGLVPVVERSE